MLQPVGWLAGNVCLPEHIISILAFTVLISWMAITRGGGGAGGMGNKRDLRNWICRREQLLTRVLWNSSQMQAGRQREGTRLGLTTCYWDLDKGGLREAENEEGSVANISMGTEPAAGLPAWNRINSQRLLQGRNCWSMYQNKNSEEKVSFGKDLQIFTIFEISFIFEACLLLCVTSL